MLLCVCSVFQGCAGLSHMCVFCIECVGISMHLLANACMSHTRQLLVCACALTRAHTCGVWHSLAYRSDVCYILLETRRSPGPSPVPTFLCALCYKKNLRFPQLIIFPPQSLPDVSSVVPVPMATEVPAVVVPFCGACPGSWHYCKPRGGGEYWLVKDILRGTLLERESRMDSNRRQG